MSDYAMDFSEWVDIRGDRQNIRVRSMSADAPVLLMLHGGPGICDRHEVLEHQSALASDFTLVMWDQRGSGKSFRREILSSPVSAEDYVLDAEAMLRYLCGRFGKRRIIVEGHSWGTVVGTRLCVRCPELISAYIGQGQFVNGAANEELSYRFCVDEARRLGDEKTLAKLLSGPPAEGRYPNRAAMMTQRDCLARYGGGCWKERSGLIRTLLLPLLRTREYSLADIAGFARGATYLSDRLWSEIVALRFDETVRSLSVPVLLTMGRHDYNTPSELARQWYDALSAPKKDWVWFENSAHSPMQEEPELWSAAVRGFIMSLQSKGE